MRTFDTRHVIRRGRFMYAKTKDNRLTRANCLLRKLAHEKPDINWFITEKKTLIRTVWSREIMENDYSEILTVTKINVMAVIADNIRLAKYIASW